MEGNNKDLIDSGGRNTDMQPFQKERDTLPQI
jgi:hypothetical protein